MSLPLNLNIEKNKSLDSLSKRKIFSNEYEDDEIFKLATKIFNDYLLPEYKDDDTFTINLDEIEKPKHLIIELFAQINDYSEKINDLDQIKIMVYRLEILMDLFDIDISDIDYSEDYYDVMNLLSDDTIRGKNIIIEDADNEFNEMVSPVFIDLNKKEKRNNIFGAVNNVKSVLSDVKNFTENKNSQKILSSYNKRFE